MKILFIKFIIIIVLGSTFTNCNKGDDESSTASKEQVIVDPNDYNIAPTDNLTINSMKIEGHILKINYSSSGCSGDSWVIKLIDSGTVFESDPPRRDLVLSLKNKEMCEAYITKEISFDISKLQVEGNRVKLYITNTKDEILYQY
ncbi:hypothetical protein [Aquimarina sediminis]|uniref:hypothetical protein n=1 Tax=Aquimarina sediminis TaxID=2070536 RepID=UPI000CA03452|nr:hypothetical protein [Aquimarina sediminis]